MDCLECRDENAILAVTMSKGLCFPPRALLAYVVLVVVGFAAESSAHTAEEWKGRAIYQLLTDRFSTGTDSPSQCTNLGSYCGGTFAGIIDNLDYIQGMGFDAIWISPVVDNTDGGYHGYWAKDLFEINSHFGTAAELRALVTALHKRGMWIMLDVVGNHMGYGAPSTDFAPFSLPEHYYDCNQCPQYCNIDDWGNQNQVELCRLVGLPDLNQSNPFVASTLQGWVKQIVSNYSLDGLRIDTIPEVDKGFWGQFKAAAGVYTVGEVDNGDINYVAPYQASSPGTSAPGVDGTLSYPLFFTLQNVFARGQSMSQITDMLNKYASKFANPALLGTFIDNHDNPRFLSLTHDRQLYKNAITFVLMTQGIPIVYYGTEQWLDGTNDPANREALWNTGYSTTTDMYSLIKTVLTHRSKTSSWKEPQVQRFADDQFYAFSRGESLVLTTNVGENGHVQREITYHPYKVGTKICNIFYADGSDCVTVTSTGFGIYLAKGESKIYTPAS